MHASTPQSPVTPGNHTGAATTTTAGYVPPPSVPPPSQTNTCVVAGTGEYREREPPPYPGTRAKTLYQPGLRQSYSGSEASTDYSLSSCENLSIRQEPQGEETIAVTTSPLPGSDPRYQEMLAKISYPLSKTCPAAAMPNDNDNVNNNNNYAALKQSDSSAAYQQLVCNNNHLVAPPPPYTAPSGSPGTTPSALTLRRVTSNPVPGPLLYHTGTSSVPGTPGPVRRHQAAAPATASAPGTPSAAHKTMPLMGCGALGQTTLKQESIANNNAVFPTLPSSLAFSEPGATSSSDGSPTQDNAQSLAQLMTALTRQSSNAATTSKGKRPSTAPATKHLPTVPPPLPLPPPPPEYPGYNKPKVELPVTSAADRIPLVWSQPDLSRLADFQMAGPDLSCTLSSSTGARESVPPPPPCYVTAADPTGHYPPALSTSSSTSSLMAAYSQYSGGGGALDTTQDLGLDLASLDLSTLDPSLLAQLQSLSLDNHGSQSPLLRKLPELGHAAVATRATKMVERLSEENCFLRQELEVYANKVYRLQKLEIEIQKVHENYETLEKHSQKQESLEKLMRYKLVSEIKKLRDTNKELKDHLDKAIRQLQQKEVYTVVDSDTKKELLGKDSLIAKLISQNRELTTCKEQLEQELVAGRSTLQEQRSHISLLENALSTARASLAAHEQSEKQSCEEDKLSELQKSLTQLQGAVEKREVVEQKLRQKLEEEVQYLRNQQVGQSRASTAAEADEGISSDSESPTSLQSLVRQMADKDQRVLSLEAEVAKWKQKFLEERALRQFAVDVASVPKDARIAALEQSSYETEKLIAEARSERIQHLEEVHIANRKCAELENKIKTLQAQLAERDAMIKVLQHHSPHSNNSSLGSLLGSPLHSPHPSLTSPLTSPHHSPLHSQTPSGASSRQNSQLDTTYSRGGDRNSPTDREGGAQLHNMSNSLGLGTTASRNNSPSQDHQLQELHRLTAQAALYGGFPGSDPLKKFMWQV